MGSGFLDNIIMHSDMNQPTPAPHEAMDHIHELNVPLSKGHYELLSKTNGITAFDGYFRLLGASGDSHWNMIDWNQNDYWKFAWTNALDDFWCFAMNAWGSQYAYRKTDGTDHIDNRIYYLDNYTMSPRVAADSFEELMERLLIRLGTSSLGPNTLEVRSKLGPVGRDKILMYNPSLVLGGEEAIENIVTMDSRLAMIINGDIYTQWNQASDGMILYRLESYSDDKQRQRIRLLWK